MKQFYHHLHLLLPKFVVLLFLFGTTGCQFGAANSGVEPTATPTWPPLPTTTPTVVPPSALPATETPAPALSPTPFSTPIVTPTPEYGYYGDPKIGFSFFYPSEWVAEAGSSWIRITNDNPWVWILGESSLMDDSEDMEDFITNLSEFLDDEGTLELVDDTTITLWNGMEARVFDLSSAEEQVLARITTLERGRRVFYVIILALEETFEAYPETLSAIAASMNIEEPRPYGISRENAMFLAGGQPNTLDPAKTGGSAGGEIGAIFSGLVMLDENLQIAPDLAESWEVSDDGTVYTFHLRPDAYFHNGKTMTAEDVKFSWERAADPELESHTAETYLGDIVGVKEKAGGEVDEISGIEVVDDHTLRVSIDAPKVYFLAKLTYPTAFVVDKENVQNENWEHHPNGTGPFRLLTWEDDQLIILQRNDNFYLEPANLEYVVSMMYADVPMWMYENNEIDITGVSVDNLERVTDPSDPLNKELQIIPSLCTSRLVFDVEMEPFDDPLVREAFAYSVDREKLADVVSKGAAQPAQTILPPGMPGYSPDITSPGFDPEKAQQSLANSTYGSAEALPEITYTSSGLGSELSDFEAAIVDMWRTHLDVEVSVEQLEPSEYSDEIRKSHGQMFSLGWCADYPDPENFLDVLYHSDSKENIGNYSNSEVDSLLEQARIEPDVEKRLALYHQVEQMIIDDNPNILLTRGQIHYLINPDVKNYPVSPIGQVISWRLPSVERSE